LLKQQFEFFSVTIVVDAIIHGRFSLYKHVCLWDTLMANPIAGWQNVISFFLQVQQI